MEPDPHEFRMFLADALAHGWPDNTRPSESAAFPDFVEGHFRVGDWRYVDLWSGATTDVGAQFVFCREKVYWGCTYRGGIMAAEFVTDGSPSRNPLYRFLAAALRQPAWPDLPIRGPARHVSEDGQWTYTLQGRGTLESFVAVEHILHGSDLVYERVLTGGRCGDAVRYGTALASSLGLTR